MATRIKPFHEQPKEGTKLRKLYDLFRENKGRPVSLREYFPNGRDYTAALDQLARYDLVIEKAKKPNEYVLVGEYVGRDFVEYKETSQSV